MGTVPETLHAFGPSTLVVRAVGAALAALGEPELAPYPTVDTALGAADVGARAGAHQAASDMVASAILALGAAVDGADRAMVRAAEASGSDQSEDAVLKALAIAAFARRLGGDGPAERVERLLALPSGRALVATWGAVDVALPLGPTEVAGLLAAHPQQVGRLAAIAGEEALDGVSATMPALLGALQGAVDAAVARSEALALALAPYVPGLVATADGAGAAIARQTDRLPIYKWMAARIAVEDAVRRATGR